MSPSLWTVRHQVTSAAGHWRETRHLGPMSYVTMAGVSRMGPPAWIQDSTRQTVECTGVSLSRGSAATSSTSQWPVSFKLFTQMLCSERDSPLTSPLAGSRDANELRPFGVDHACGLVLVQTSCLCGLSPLSLPGGLEVALTLTYTDHAGSLAWLIESSWPERN